MFRECSIRGVPRIESQFALPIRNFLQGLTLSQRELAQAISCSLPVRAAQKISGPCGSYDAFAPTCSTRLFQLSPRK